MKVLLAAGIGELLFGMKTSDVEEIYGAPDKIFNDDDKNLIYLYNRYKWRLTFYSDEDFRLGYVISSHPDLKLFNINLIGEKIEIVKQNLNERGFRKWEQEYFDTTENHFNEEHWLILQAEFGEVISVEVGAIINDKDEFNWKFKSK